MRAVVPKNLVYYHIKSTNPLSIRQSDGEIKNRDDLVCDNLDMEREDGPNGHFIKFGFNSIGIIDEVTYLVGF